MEIGEKIYVNTEGSHKVGTVDSTTVHETAAHDKFIIILEEGETIDDGEHFMCEFEPAPIPQSIPGTGESTTSPNYLKLNRGNGY
jgi:hypothetical protein